MLATVFILFWLLVVVLPPIIISLVKGGGYGSSIEKLMTIVGARTVNYIVPGTFYPENSYYQPYVERLVGDVKICHWGHIEYDPEGLANKIVNDARRHGYSFIRVITFSLGDRITKPLGRMMAANEVAENRLEIWTVDPCPTSDFIKPSLLWTLRILTPFVIVIRILLGWFAEVPVISRDGRKNSIAEIEGFLFEMAYNSRDYFKDPVFSCIKVAIEDDEIFYDPGRTERQEERISAETEEVYTISTPSSITFEKYGNKHWWNNKGSSLCNIGDPTTAEGYHHIFKETGLYGHPQ